MCPEIYGVGSEEVVRKKGSYNSLYTVKLPSKKGDIIADEKEGSSIKIWEEKYGREEKYLAKLGTKEGLLELLADRENKLRCFSGGGIKKTNDDYMVLIQKDEYSPRDPMHLVSANGYSQNMDEVGKPMKTIRREMSEELLMVEESRNERKVLVPEEIKNEIYDVDIKELFNSSPEISRYSMEFENDKSEIYITQNNELISRLNAVFAHEPKRAGINLLKEEKLPLDHEDLVNGKVNFYDGEGDLEGWNRNIVLVNEENFYKAVKESEETGEEQIIPGYKSEMEGDGRDFNKTSIKVGPRSLKKEQSYDYKTLQEMTEEGNIFFEPSEPLRKLLVYNREKLS